MSNHDAPRPASPRCYLDVPYDHKDEAKAAGARWDPTARRWYDPRPPTPALTRWTARPDVPDLLPGEDRSFGDGLFVDLVPRSCWFTNVRSCVSQQDWERLRRPILHRADLRCEACGAPEDRAAGQWLDVHERWHYDDHRGVQTLRRLIAVCKPCHLVTHFGFANVTGRTDEAFAHLRKVTGMPHAEAWAHVRAAEDLWISRSARTWRLDLSILTDVGVTVRRPEPAADRGEAADRALRQVRPAAEDRTPPLRTAVRPAPAPSQPEPASEREPTLFPVPVRRGMWARLTGRS